MAQPPTRSTPAPANRFVGRLAERDELAALVAHRRLVTLVGPGGCGKTRLAIEVARTKPSVEFVDLSSVRDPAAIRPLVAGLSDELGPARTLLVLDNCEHVIESVREQVTGMLRSWPNLHVLATSREPLRLEAEQVWRVRPLSIDESVELFVDRAAMGTRSFQLTTENGDDITHIALAFEGLPLGIELAAAWVPVLGVTGIRERMASRLDLFADSPHATATRHQTLRSAIEWSNDLLDPRERELWWRLGAFAPPFDLDAVEAVCSSGEIGKRDVPHLLRRLVERSLVQTQGDSARVGFRLLDTVRDFCIEQLNASGELDRIAEAHARYYVSLAEEAFRHRDASDLIPWAVRMTAAHPNVRLALAWLRDHDPESAMQLSGAMGWVWGARELLPEGRRLLEESLRRSDTWFAARAHRASGILALEQGDEAAARKHLNVALELHEQHGDEAGQAIVLARLGILTRERATLERAAELAERSGERTALVVSLANLGALELKHGNARSARLRFEQAAVLSREMGHARWLPSVLEGLAQAQLADGDPASARKSSGEAITRAEESKLAAIIPSLLETMAAVAAASSAPERALRLAGAASGLREAQGAVPHEWPSRLEKAIAQARRAVPGAADALLAEGARLPADEAIALALTAAESDKKLPSAGVAISRRQAQVAALIAAGLTNAQIGSRLHIAERTAEWHVEELCNRLGFSSRAQVAAWAARQGLDQP